MKKFFGFLVVVLILGGVFVAFGGTETVVSLQRQLSKQPEKKPRSRLSAKQQQELKAALKTEVIATYPTEIGFARIYGSITNPTHFELVEASLEIETRQSTKTSTSGKGKVRNVRPGQKATFDIMTSTNASEIDEVTVEVVKAQFE